MKTIEWDEVELGDTVAIQYFNGDSLLEGKVVGHYKKLPLIRVGNTEFKITDPSEWEILTHQKPKSLPTAVGSKVYFSETLWILLPVYLTLIGQKADDEVSMPNQKELIWVALEPFGVWAYNNYRTAVMYDDLEVVYDADAN